MFSGCLYLADYGSTDPGLADPVIRKMNSILSTWERDYTVATPRINSRRVVLYL